MAKPPAKKSQPERLLRQAAEGFLELFASPGVQPGGEDFSRGSANSVLATLNQRDKTKTQPNAASIPMQAPSTLEQIPVTIDMMRELVTQKPTTSPLMQKMKARVAGSRKTAQEMADIGDPQNALEVIANIAGGLVVPGPKGAGAVRNPSALKTMGKIAAETLLPLRQGGAKVAAYTAGVGAGLYEAIDSFVDVPEYNGIADAARKKFGNKDPDANFFADDPDAGFFDDDPNDPDANFFADDQFHQPIKATGMTLPEKAAVAVAGIGALYLGKKVVGTARAFQKTKVTLPDGTLSGTKFNPQITSTFDNLISGVAKSNNAVTVALQKDAPVLAKEVTAHLDALAPATSNQKFKYTLETGSFPNSTVNAGRIADDLNVIATSTSPEEKEIIERGLAAKQALNQAKIAKKQTMFTGGGIDIPKLQSYANILDNDPKLKPIADRMVNINRKVLEYQLDRGHISQKQFDELIKNNAEYVHLSAAYENMNDSTMLGVTIPRGRGGNLDDTTISRSLEEGEGVQTGALAGILSDLPVVIRNVITSVESNAAKRAALEALDGGGLYKIKKVDKPDFDTVTVRVDGKDIHYQVPDKAVRDQLDFTPSMGRGIGVTIAHALNSPFVVSTVGRAFNAAFGAITSTYQNWGAATTRNKGTNLGLINEVLANAGLPTLGRFDLTGHPIASPVTIPINTMRYLVDAGVQQLGKELTYSLGKSHPVFDIMFKDDAARNAMAAKLSQAYEASIKGDAEKAGLFGAHLYGDNNPQAGLQGIESLMPDFAVYAAQRARAETLAGDPSVAKRMFENAKVFGVRVNASKFVRLYDTVTKALSNASDYGAYAANRHRIVKGESAAAVAQDVRRLGGDMSQSGGNNVFNTIGAFNTFSNAVIQPMIEFGRAIKHDAPTTLTNIAAVVSSAVLYRYLSAMLDPSVAETIKSNSPQQNSTYIPGAAGMHVVIDQGYRILLAPLFAYLDEIVGLNSDEGMDLNWQHMFARIADGLDEKTEFNMGQGALAGFQSALPYSPANIPMLNAAAAAGGINIGASRLAGAPIVIKEDSFDQEDRGLTARLEEMLSAASGATIGTWIKAAEDLYAGTHNGDDLQSSLKVAVSRLVDKAASTHSPIEGVIFYDYVKAKTMNNTTTQLYYKKMEMVDEIRKTWRDEFQHPGMTVNDPRLARARPTDHVRPEYYNTAVYPISATTADMMKDIDKMQDELSQIRKVDKDLRDRSRTHSSRIEDRNIEHNKLVKEASYIEEQILYRMNQAEEDISGQIGERFSYRTGNFERYKTIPFPPQPADPGTDAPQ